MDTREAIEKVFDKYEGWQGYARSQKEADELAKERNEVIAQLNRGEKFKKIVEELNNLDFMSNKEKLLMNYEDFANLLNNIKQKHFPKDEVIK